MMLIYERDWKENQHNLNKVLKNGSWYKLMWSSGGSTNNKINLAEANMISAKVLINNNFS
ncbi:hypothetical protein PSHI8_22240 [Polynucleobacter sp. SHI8]|nr:hypothetical protein PSHI2_22220 [Polynucleobacter sp. SHI2]BDW14588.1 hypothetical protein PSHI8_22240 [Polynucleobacter sp. SHI8]